MKKLFTLVVVMTALFASGIAQTCDTLFNLSDPVDTPIIYLADTGVSPGYLSGNNVYGDLAKAEAFTGVMGGSVSAAALLFGIATINPADTNNTVTVAVWDNTGTDISGAPGGPGNVIDSVNITLGQIAAAINSQSLQGLVAVNFTGAVTLTADTVYVGVILPTTTGDTLALFTNTFNGANGMGWEYEYDYITNDGYSNAWGSYDYDWGSTGLGNYISAVVCSPTTGINTVTDGVTFKMYPNPASDQLNFQWSLNSEADVAMYDVAGNVVKTFTINGSTLNTFDISDLASGAYIVRITDRANNVQRSTLFNKL